MKISQLKPGLGYCELPMQFLAQDVTDFAEILDENYCQRDHGRQLLANLFRRFGYPNSGWDRYSEVACYRLTTPDQDAILQFVPYVGSNASLRISLLVVHSVMNAMEAHDTLARRRWRQRMDDWLEANLKVPEAARNEFISLYSEIEPPPPRYQRDRNWRAWDESDPLKPLFKAAYDALQDLKRPLSPSISPSMAPSAACFGRYGKAMPGSRSAFDSDGHRWLAGQANAYSWTPRQTAKESSHGSQ